jgi:hypothetical protein
LNSQNQTGPRGVKTGPSTTFGRVANATVKAKAREQLARALLPRVRRLLMKLGRDARKLRVELGAEAVDYRDNCDRDASRD